MSEQAATHTAEVEALRETYAALNRNDISAAIKAFDPQIVWIEPAHYPAGGTYHGLAEVEALLSRSRATWAEGGCVPERFIIASDKVIVFIHVRVRLKNQDQWVDGRQADVYTFRNGKAVEMRIFPEQQEAPAWAGADAAAAT